MCLITGTYTSSQQSRGPQQQCQAAVGCQAGKTFYKKRTEGRSHCTPVGMELRAEGALGQGAGDKGSVLVTHFLGMQNWQAIQTL